MKALLLLAVAFALSLAILAGASPTFADVPSAPSDVRVSISANGKWVELRWTPPDDPDELYRYQVVKVRVVPAVGGIEWRDIYTNTTTEIMDFGIDKQFGLKSGTQYLFRVVGQFKGSGNYGPWSNRATIRVPASKPAPVEAQPIRSNAPISESRNPTSLTASQRDGAVVLEWTPGRHQSHTSQIVVRREARRGTSLEAIKTFADLTAATYTDTTVEAGKKYIYRVRAMKSNGHYFTSRAEQITVR